MSKKARVWKKGESNREFHKFREWESVEKEATDFADWRGFFLGGCVGRFVANFVGKVRQTDYRHWQGGVAVKRGPLEVRARRLADREHIETDPEKVFMVEVVAAVEKEGRLAHRGKNAAVVYLAVLAPIGE